MRNLNQNILSKKLYSGFHLFILSGLIFSLCITSCQSNADKSAGDTNATANDTTKVKADMTLGVEKVIDNMAALTDMVFPGNGDMWITEQTGKVWVIKNGTKDKEPLLDLSSKMVKLHNGYEEKGLLGITLHPDFKNNKKFYTYYSRPSEIEGSDNTGVLAEYTLPETGAIDPNSGRIILTVEEPQGNHNGGCIKFGPDGYLYVSLGDGGGQHDEHGTIGNGQNKNVLLGKMLRIDVNTGNGYKVPVDNPFVGQADTRPEIWAYGLRNPYRFSFDQKTGQLFAGDVGQDLWEEVDIVNKGGNYGWRIVEGTHCHNAKNTPDESCDTTGITMPITEYSHKEGISVIGGYVYHGKQIPDLDGKYVFADWTGPVFYLQNAGAKWERKRITLGNIPPNLKITGINEDADGELYFLTNPDTGIGSDKCTIYKIVKS